MSKDHFLDCFIFIMMNSAIKYVIEKSLMNWFEIWKKILKVFLLTVTTHLDTHCLKLHI
jgi:hypothetical protein